MNTTIIGIDELNRLLDYKIKATAIYDYWQKYFKKKLHRRAVRIKNLKRVVDLLKEDFQCPTCRTIVTPTTKKII